MHLHAWVCANLTQSGSETAFIPWCYTSGPSPTWVRVMRPGGPAEPAGVPGVSSSAGLISSNAIGAPVITQAIGTCGMGNKLQISPRTISSAGPSHIYCLQKVCFWFGSIFFIYSLGFIHTWNVLVAFHKLFLPWHFSKCEFTAANIWANKTLLWLNVVSDNIGAWYK